jgi:hypothetical protein
MTMQPPPNNIQDWGKNFFLEEPEFGFLGALGQQPGMTRSMSDFFRQNTGQFLGRFNQRLANQVTGGELPTQNAFDWFMGQGNGWSGFQNEFLSFAPGQRGETSRQFAPNTRFLFGSR